MQPACAGHDDSSAAHAQPAGVGLVEERRAHFERGAGNACDQACSSSSQTELPAWRLGAVSAARSGSEGLACILPQPDEPAPAAQASQKQGKALWGSLQAPKLGAYEGMTIAASLAGAVAGGAAAGPLGVSLGALICGTPSQ